LNTCIYIAPVKQKSSEALTPNTRMHSVIISSYFIVGNFSSVFGLSVFYITSICFSVLHF